MNNNSEFNSKEICMCDLSLALMTQQIYMNHYVWFNYVAVNYWTWDSYTIEGKEMKPNFSN